MSSNARWECNACTYSNEPSRDICEMCGEHASRRSSTERVVIHPAVSERSLDLKPADIELKAMANAGAMNLEQDVEAPLNNHPAQRNFNFDFNFEIDDATKDVCGVVAAALGIISVLLLIILLSISFQYIEYDQYGLKKDTTTSKVDYSQVYGYGRYCWGPTSTTVTFPSLYQTVEFAADTALVVFTNSGVNITLEVSFQYQLEKNHVVDIFSSYGTDYDTQVQNVGRASIKNAAVKFGVSDYFLNRQSISNAMLNQLQNDLTRVWANVPAHKFQLRKVTYPDIITSRYLSAAVIAQQTLQLTAQRSADVYRAETTLLVTTTNATANIVGTQAQADISQILSEASAQADGVRTSADGYGVEYLCQTLGISTIQDKLEFLNLYRTAQNSGSTALFGLASNNVFISR